MNINSNEPLFCPRNVLLNKCSGNCNDITSSYAKLYVHDIVKKWIAKYLS